MEYLEVEEIRKRWGGQPCDHPDFEEETIGRGDGGYPRKTGDYVCPQCGEVFTKAERDEIKAKRAQGNH